MAYPPDFLYPEDGAIPPDVQRARDFGPEGARRILQREVVNPNTLPEDARAAERMIQRLEGQQISGYVREPFAPPPPQAPQDLSSQFMSAFGPIKPPPADLSDSFLEPFRQGVAGLAVDLPRVVGQAMKRTASSPVDGAFLRGQQIVDAANERAKDWEPNPNVGGVSRFLGAGARGVATGLPVMALGAVPGVGLPLAVGGGGALFGLSQAQETQERLASEGVDPSQARMAGNLTGGLAGLTSGAIQMAGGRLLAPQLEKAFGGGMEGLASRLTSDAIAGPLAKAAGKNLAVDTAMMGAQMGGTNLLERAYGSTTEQTPWQATKEGLTTGLAMGVVASPLGIPGHVRQARMGADLGAALNHENPAVRAQARQIIGQIAESQGVPRSSIIAWAEQQIALQQPTNLMDTGKPKPTVVGSDQTMPMQAWLDQQFGKPIEDEALRKKREEDLQAAFEEPTGKNVTVRNPYVTDDIVADAAKAAKGELPDITDQIEIPQTHGDFWESQAGVDSGQQTRRAAQAAARVSAPDFFKIKGKDALTTKWSRDVLQSDDPAAAIRLAYENPPKTNDGPEYLDSLNEWHKKLTGQTIEDYLKTKENTLGFVQEPDATIQAQINAVKAGNKKAVITTPSQMERVGDGGLSRTYVLDKDGKRIGVVLGLKQGKEQMAFRKMVEEQGVEKALGAIMEVTNPDAYGKSDVVVSGKDETGTPIHEEVVASPQDVAAAVQSVANRGLMPEVTTTHQVVAERREGNTKPAEQKPAEAPVTPVVEAPKNRVKRVAPGDLTDVMSLIKPENHEGKKTTFEFDGKKEEIADIGKRLAEIKAETEQLDKLAEACK